MKFIFNRKAVDATVYVRKIEARTSRRHVITAKQNDHWSLRALNPNHHHDYSQKDHWIIVVHVRDSHVGSVR